MVEILDWMISWYEGSSSARKIPAKKVTKGTFRTGTIRDLYKTPLKISPFSDKVILNRQNPETSSKLEVSQARHQSKRHVNGDNHQDIVTLTIRG